MTTEHLVANSRGESTTEAPLSARKEALSLVRLLTKKGRFCCWVKVRRFAEIPTRGRGQLKCSNVLSVSELLVIRMKMWLGAALTFNDVHR
jgi:hypothetical protein